VVTQDAAVYNYTVYHHQWQKFEIVRCREEKYFLKWMYHVYISGQGTGVWMAGPLTCKRMV